MQSFLKPLTIAEEEIELNLMQRGDRTARERLIEHNLRLVAHIVKKYNFPEKDLEDYISIGTIGLIKAIDTYKPDKGIRLATYASRCIDNEILMTLRSNRKQNHETFLSDPIGSDKEGNEVTLFDILEAENEIIEERIVQDSYLVNLKQYMYDCLTERERDILLSRYGLYGTKELTQREIADKYEISRSYVSRIEKKALQKLNHCFQVKC